jgi:hypothetical protein
LAVLVFLLISAVLARVLSIDGTERTAITLLIKAEAAGDRSAMIARIRDCGASAGCRARIAYDASALRRPGFSLTGTVGTARVAWTAGSSLPRVQCVRVRRAGDALTGFEVQLLELSRRIPSGSNCPKRF